MYKSVQECTVVQEHDSLGAHNMLLPSLSGGDFKLCWGILLERRNCYQRTIPAVCGAGGEGAIGSTQRKRV